LNGYTEGPGRADQFYAKNKITGIGRLVLVTDGLQYLKMKVPDNFYSFEPKNFNNDEDDDEDNDGSDDDISSKPKNSTIGSYFVIVDAIDTIKMGSCEYIYKPDNSDVYIRKIGPLHYYETYLSDDLFFLHSDRSFDGDSGQLECLMENMEF